MANSISAMGFPSRKPTRRGGRGKGPAGSAGVPVDHLKNLTNAMELGDHAQARSHAFALVRSLPKAQQGIPSPNDIPEASGAPDAASSGADDIDGPNVTSTKAMPPANTPAKAPSGGMRLAQMLKAKGMAKPSKAAGY